MARIRIQVVILLIFLCLTVGVLLWLKAPSASDMDEIFIARENANEPHEIVSDESSGEIVDTEASGKYDVLPGAPDARLNRRSDGYVEYLPSTELAEKLGTVAEADNDLVIVNEVLFYFRYAYQENPVGVDNAEFTRQLLGNNPKRIVFISEDNPAVQDGELLDRWGTPYFFHALSADNMEIRSAGPDTQMWTSDDLLLEGDAKL